MPALTDFIQELERLLKSGEGPRAESLVAAAADDPDRGALRRELGLCALSAHGRDAAGCLTHGQLAAALDPAEPLCHQYLAVAELMRGDRAAAAAHARDAVTRGGGRRSLGWLANILLGSGQAADAEAVYRQMLELDPADEQALNGLGACRYQQQDLDGAVGWFAQAYDHHPGEGGPIRSLMNMYGEAGRLLGAIALGNLHKERERSDEEQVALDLMLLQLTRLLMSDRFPAPGAVADADEIVADLLVRAGRRPVRVRLGVARALLDCQRYAQARELVGRLLGEAPGLPPRELSDLRYVQGLLLAHKSDVPGALAAYTAAVEADPRRWDAACNAISLLLQSTEAAALARIGALLALVPAEVKATAPQLLLNEALYLRRLGQREAARRNLERVLGALADSGPGGPQSQLGQLARQLLAEDE